MQGALLSTFGERNTSKNGEKLSAPSSEYRLHYILLWKNSAIFVTIYKDFFQIPIDITA